MNRIAVIANSDRQKRKRPLSTDKGLSNISLTMSYFHTGIRTIIGAEAFHCPVRDGKEWDHLAMVIRLNFSPSSFSS
jgi:hypothetical protein